MAGLNMAITRTVKNYARLYKKVSFYSHALSEFVDQEMTGEKFKDVAALHETVRADDNFCAYSTYQISILTDENGIEHRSAPINESRMVKFGEIALAQKTYVPVYSGYSAGLRPYADMFPETRDKQVVTCGVNVRLLQDDDIIHDRKTGQRVWPALTPRIPRPGPAP